MGERSRRRVRDLVARLAFKGRSQNETERARISMMARSDLLHTRAGYRSARPITAILKIQLATHGRSIQSGHEPTGEPSCRQLVEQGLGLLQVRRVKALGEPAVDRSEKFLGLIPLPLIAPQPRHADSRAKLKGFRTLVAGNLES